MSETGTIPLHEINPNLWEIPQSYKPGMRVPGRVYANAEMLQGIVRDQALEQVANVATLPGIVGASLAMPDIHWGYGFPVGGVAATSVDEGVISPGGIGYDINCGVRLLATDLRAGEIMSRLERLADVLATSVPAGMGGASHVKLKNRSDLDRVLREGAAWAIAAGYGRPEDLERIEEGGRLAGADPEVISPRARERGMKQVGSLGSGNHFLEIQRVDEVFDAETAKAFGLFERQVVIFIHTGSRGFGHQVCTDSLHAMSHAGKTYGIELPDRQLACAPISSPEGQTYLAAMACAANFAWANRQCITHWAREAMASVFGEAGEDVRIVYDVSHNIAKFEEYDVEGDRMELCVHRKGATRAFPAGHPALAPSVREHGQPVLIPGDMGRYSYVAVGTEEALRQSFGSTCHGAGRVRSRSSARKLLEGVDVRAELKRRGIIVRVRDPKLLAEEASEAYKDVANVIDVVDAAGISRKVARMRPLAVIKG
jgi:tRNA-splicing ligase RtcB (3'-phosphate/5'-hydroxy nucleic acid ligase)